MLYKLKNIKIFKKRSRAINNIKIWYKYIKWRERFKRKELRKVLLQEQEEERVRKEKERVRKEKEIIKKEEEHKRIKLHISTQRDKF